MGIQLISGGMMRKCRTYAPGKIRNTDMGSAGHCQCVRDLVHGSCFPFFSVILTSQNNDCAGRRAPIHLNSAGFAFFLELRESERMTLSVPIFLTTCLNISQN